MAIAMEWISDMVRFCFPLSRALSIEAMAIDEMIPRIATTTSSSMRVKPLSRHIIEFLRFLNPATGMPTFRRAFGAPGGSVAARGELTDQARGWDPAREARANSRRPSRFGFLAGELTLSVSRAVPRCGRR